MKVRALIELLRAMPQDGEVLICVAYDDAMATACDGVRAVRLDSDFNEVRLLGTEWPEDMS